MEPWGSYVDIKIDAPDLLTPVVTKCRNRVVYLSSVCDPYQPVEAAYQLIPVQPKLTVHTKSALIVRDLDLLKQFRECSVGMTIVTTDENLLCEIEPGASPIETRMNVLKQLQAAGLKTYIFVGPILPYLTGWKQVVNETRSFVNYYLFDHTKPSGRIWDNLYEWLNTKHSDLLSLRGSAP